MITRDSLVVIFLSPDESEENNTCHVSRVPSSPPTADCFVFALISPALNLLSGSQGAGSCFTKLNEKASGSKGTALRCAYTAPHTSYFFLLITRLPVLFIDSQYVFCLAATVQKSAWSVVRLSLLLWTKTLRY